MDYVKWLDDIFGRPVETDPATVELSAENGSATLDEQFDLLDRCLVDAELHQRYSPEQLGLGLSILYPSWGLALNTCYVEAGDEPRRLRGIANLQFLYSNFFNRYCGDVVSIGNDPGRMSFVCYMLWELLVVLPEDWTPAMVDAALEVLQSAINFQNESCIVSAIHGLGH